MSALFIVGMEDFKDAQSTDLPYEVGNVFLRFQLRVCGANHVVIETIWIDH